jgi:microcystin-dependent protein
MSSIFPANPEVNDEFQGYRFNGVAWQIIGIDLTAEYPVITNGTISDSAVPATVARTESPTFTGTVELPITTNIGDVSHSEIQTLNGVTHSVQDQVNTKAPLDNPTFTGTVTLPSTTSVGNVSATEIGYLDGVTGSIQTQINGKTTASYVDNAVATAVANVIDTAPGTLDTLNELAAALGDDPNFATTITNALAAKLNSVPGVISQYAGTALPTGYLWCEGGEFLISTYQNLYNALTTNGTVFPYGANTNGSGGAGSTHFRLPNLKGRIPVGKDSAQIEFDALGETGGSKISVAPHTHGINHDHPSFNATSGGMSANESHAHAHRNDSAPGSGGWDGVFSSVRAAYYSYTREDAGVTSTNTAHTHTTTIDVPNFTGTSGAASAATTSGNLQPYIVVNYIIKF